MLYDDVFYEKVHACLFQGTLKGFDQTINLILDESHERVFSSSQGVEQVILGLYIVRGDNVYEFLLFLSCLIYVYSAIYI